MDFDDYVQQGLALCDEKKWVPALENLEAALKIKPNEEFILQMVAMLKTEIERTAHTDQALLYEIKLRSEKMGITDVDKAIGKYVETLAINPQNDLVRINLAYVYYLRGLMFTAKGEHGKAIEDYSEAINLKPDHTFAINRRAGAYHATGNYDQAIIDYEKLIQLSPDDARMKKELANVYVDRGNAAGKINTTNAAADYKMALQYYPGNIAAVELLREAQPDTE